MAILANVHKKNPIRLGITPPSSLLSSVNRRLVSPFTVSGLSSRAMSDTASLRERPNSPAPPEDQARLLEEALAIVRAHAASMKRCIDKLQILDSLKHASMMLAELRSSSLGPKHYYELYMAVFDSLRYLSTYIREAHISGKQHCADLYEIVQYAGNIVPRMYLMITVGSVYMSVPEAPVREIMRDMLEMSRGVQHPIRGLFLRHYLSGQTRDHLPVGDSTGPGGNLKDSISFVLTNFVEMNKLWVRLQFQGHSRDRALREQERKELRILVGTNLVRLSQLEGIDLELYTGQILPMILEQVIQCRDVLAQEYLMEVITQVFTDDLHLRTLDQFLSATAKLNPAVNVKQIISAMIDRLADYAKREAESEDPEERKKKEEDAATRLADEVTRLRLRNSGNSEEASFEEKEVSENGMSETPAVDGEKTQGDGEPVKRFRGIPIDVKLFEVFWEQLVGLVKARPDLPIQDISALLVSICNLALNCYPDKLDYVDKVLSYAKDKTAEFVNSPDLHSPSTQNNFLSLLLAPISSYSNLLTILALPNYLKLLHAQTYATRRSVAAAVSHSILNNNTIISTPEDVQGVLSLIRVLIKEGVQASPIPGSTQRLSETEETIEEQGWLARMVHLFTNKETPETDFEILKLVRDAYWEAPGERCKYTSGSLVTAGIKLIRRFKAREHLDNDWETKISAGFKFVHTTISHLLRNVPSVAEMALRQYLFAAQIADSTAFPNQTYDFLEQSFSIYEEQITESKTQYSSLMGIANTLQSTRSLDEEQFNTLALRTAQFGGKLLRRVDQARAIFSASHLWWAQDSPYLPETEEKPLFHDDKRVLECLQKSMRIADASILDPPTSITVFIEILNHYLYYFDKDSSIFDSSVQKYITNLVEMIRGRLDELGGNQATAASQIGGSSGVCEPDANVDEWVRKFFERTMQGVGSRDL